MEGLTAARENREGKQNAQPRRRACKLSVRVLRCQARGVQVLGTVLGTGDARRPTAPEFLNI